MFLISILNAKIVNTDDKIYFSTTMKIIFILGQPHPFPLLPIEIVE